MKLNEQNTPSSNQRSALNSLSWSKQALPACPVRSAREPSINVRTSDSLPHLLRETIPVDVSSRLLWHNLMPGKKVDLHFHPDATEWLIFEQGRFEILTASSSNHIKGTAGTWHIVRFGPGVAHGLISHEESAYFVVRDRDDETVYLDRDRPRRTSLHGPTLSIVVGDTSCNAKCTFCSPKMLGLGTTKNRVESLGLASLDSALTKAAQLGIKTVQITSEGEPTLFPEQITQYLNRLALADFESVELQTNGIKLATDRGYLEQLKTWKKLGLGTIAISIVHYEPEKNRSIYMPSQTHYPNLSALVSNLHKIGFKVRFSCTLLKGYIDTAAEVEQLFNFAGELNVEEINLRPVRIPKGAEETSRTHWVRQHSLTDQEIELLGHKFTQDGLQIAELPHGASLFMIKGMKVCFALNKSENHTPSAIRRLILLPDGSLRTDWP